jgi:hypothetical protein
MARSNEPVTRSQQIIAIAVATTLVIVLLCDLLT